MSKLMFFCMHLVMLSLLAKEETTCIGRYVLSEMQLADHKVFENDSSKRLLLRWRVCPIENDIVGEDIAYVQHAIIPSHKSYELDLSKAADFITLKAGKIIKKYEVNLSVGIVSKAPKKPHADLSCRSLKWSESGSQMKKNEFLGNHTFRLKKAKNGQILYQAIV